MPRNNASVVDVVFGPTASGKTQHAIARALETGARDCVIINADAMQCYEGLPILSAQPDAAERAGIAHELFSYVAPSLTLTAAAWAKDAAAIIDAAHARTQHVIVVGGTGFYLKALMDGLSPIPPVDAAARVQSDAVPLADAYAQLQQVDPVMAAKLSPNDSQRVRRALCVFLSTQRPLSHWQSLPPVPAPYTFDVTVLDVQDRAWLSERITARLHNMLKAGALDEVAAMQARIDAGESDANAPALKTLGFIPLRDHIRGECSLDAAIEKTALQSRQYAKRQMTWARGQIRADNLIIKPPPAGHGG